MEIPDAELLKFEESIEEVIRLVHSCGGLVYGDGANINALTGFLRSGAIGIDIMHYNLHKTFATPHGGGGPGSRPASARLPAAPFRAMWHTEIAVA